jgi:hypothetical protein
MVDLWKTVGLKLRKSDIAGAIAYLEKLLVKEKVDRFQGLLGKKFSNSPSSILRAINKFIRASAKDFDVQAIYIEMNGFDINPDRWHFDFFGYEQYGRDPKDTEWLCDWQSDDDPDITLKGLEKVQADFEWYHDNEIWNDKKYTKAYEIAVILVMCKFASLIESALQSGARAKPIPVLATAHDFDIFGRFEA